jgi:transcription antitermination factor NusG
MGLFVAPACPDRSNDAYSEWFVAQVRGGREFSVAEHLTQRKYEAFVPSYCERRRWYDRTKIIDRPLFSGYVFWRSYGQVFGRVVEVPGVSRPVGDHQGPSPVAAWEIENLKRVIQMQVSLEPWPTPDRGQRVRIQAGPLRGIEGVVLSGKKRHRLVLSVSLLQRAVAAEVDSEWIDVPCPVLASCAGMLPGDPARN